MSVAIRADGIGKQYFLGARMQHGSLRESIVHAAKAPLRWFRPKPGAARRDEAIWALRDVSFEIQQGDIVGLIGRNGSGKSTLLKVLSRITEPTCGTVRLTGRVGSLLEVGTGFHHELTGRENVFVNGAILGMSRGDIARKFDEIVEFADVSQFIDTPVKHYSSGMQMRLAFSVAAHLEPEILLVDEVLAVGDISFQRKCLGKMDDVSRAGRTVIFVSHQMNQLRRLCSRCIWLTGGSISATGAAAEILNRYEASFIDLDALSQAESTSQGAAFLAWTLGPSGSMVHTIRDMGPVTVRFVMRVDRPIRSGHHGITLSDREGAVMWGAGTDDLTLQPGIHEFVYSFEMMPVRPGPYRWHVSLFEADRFITNLDCIPELSVETTPLGHRRDDLAGVLNLPFTFEVKRARVLDETRPDATLDLPGARALAQARR